ncbi:MAG: hypothetical protein IKT44_02825 [Clostridia bacterium]|nr:hypothetical protein [Clostridia bacterium]
MNDNFPTPITTENDLSFYENYLHQEFDVLPKPTHNLTDYLKPHIGKTIKADCAVGNRLESKIGILTQVGEDFITITLQSKKDMIIGLKTVKFLTILQNSIKNPYF